MSGRAETPPSVDEFDLAWSDSRLLGFGPIDETHREFYDVAFMLLTCTAGNARDAIAAFERHAIAHFDQEETLMLESGYPSIECHVHEHAAVLASVVAVRQRIDSGRADHAIANDLARHLLRWFPGHADYLDSALVSWISKRRYGGKPVVFRRAL